VRNYQARNFMRDGMQVGDGVLFYHSSCPQPGMAGVAEVASTAYPDHSQFEEEEILRPKATPEQPRWISVDVRGTQKTALLSWPRCARCRRWKTCCCSEGQPPVHHAGDAGAMESHRKLLG
jgi:predicted RNA-binding protein with PUA-like domain